MEHSTPRESDPIDAGTLRRQRIPPVPAPTTGSSHMALTASVTVPRLVEDAEVAWEDRIIADMREHDAAWRRRREAAVLRRLNRPHRRFARWLRSWRG